MVTSCKSILWTSLALADDSKAMITICFRTDISRAANWNPQSVLITPRTNALAGSYLPDLVISSDNQQALKVHSHPHILVGSSGFPPHLTISDAEERSLSSHFSLDNQQALKVPPHPHNFGWMVGSSGFPPLDNQ